MWIVLLEALADLKCGDSTPETFDTRVNSIQARDFGTGGREGG